jgi:hypothetical protein
MASGIQGCLKISQSQNLVQSTQTGHSDRLIGRVRAAALLRVRGSSASAVLQESGRAKRCAWRRRLQLRHVLGFLDAQRDDSVSQASTERVSAWSTRGGGFLVIGPHQYLFGLQTLQLLDQQLVADPLNQGLELAVALRAVAQGKQDKRSPLLRDDVERGVQPAG